MEQLWTTLKYLVLTQENMGKIFLFQNLKGGSPNYEAGMLSTSPRRSMLYYKLTLYSH
jgi:hypothetical protein